MAEYRYRAVETGGAVTEGDLEAGGRQEAYRILEKRKLTPVSLTERRTSHAPEEKASGLSFRRRRVSFVDLETFTLQLSNLLAAGVPLSRSLRILTREATSPSASEKWKEIHDKVIDGVALADAMAQSEGTFPRIYVAMVRAGEAGGFLDVVLRQIAEFQRREKDLKSKVISALIYPTVLAVLAVAVLTFLMIFFVPRFQKIFDDFGASLPVLTKIVVGVSGILTKYIPFVVLGVVVLVVTVRRWLQTENGRRTWDSWMLQMPVVGKITARFGMVRFCRMLGTLRGAGVPLIYSLRVARESIGNQNLIDAVDPSIESVQQGDRLAKSLEGCRELFPSSVLEIISIAEETGRLDEELVRLASVTEGDLDRQLRMAVAMAEPAMLFVIALVIGLIVVSMLLPIFLLQDFIK